MTACKYPGCAHEDNSRPYARKRDGIPSASTIAGLLDTGRSRSFAWSAALIAATEASHHSENWAGLVDVPSDRAIKNKHTGPCGETKDTLCKSCTYLRSEFDRRWSEKANLGSHCHHLALSWAEGKDVEVDDTTEPFMDALEQFYKQHLPTWLYLETTILYDNPKSHAYRGQFDAIAELDCPVCNVGPPDGTWALDGPTRCKWLLDIKTGGYWPAEQSLQLAGYRYAKHITDWSTGTEEILASMPLVAHAGVILLRPDLAQLVELPADGDAHGTFLRLRDAWGWSRQMEKWEAAHPLDRTETDL